VDAYDSITSCFFRKVNLADILVPCWQHDFARTAIWGKKCAESCSPTNINNHFFKFFRLIMINRLQAKLGSCFTSFLAKTDVGALLGY
jgi:hypothetical protein